MEKRQLVEMVGIAGVTMVVTLGMFFPVGGQASSPDKENAPEITWPTMKKDGWEVTLRAEECTYKAGETPTLEVVAQMTDEAVEEFKVHIYMVAEAPTSPFSRMPSIGRQIWKYDCRLLASGGKTQTISIPTEVKIPKGESVTLSMSSGSTSVATRSLTSVDATSMAFAIPMDAKMLQVKVENPASAAGTDVAVSSVTRTDTGKTVD